MRNEDEDDEEDERIFRQLQRKPGAKPMVKPTAKLATARSKPFVVGWIKFPRRWAEALRQSKSVATYQLALAILFEAFKRKRFGQEIVLSSAITKMPKETRRRATSELVKFELIEVEQGGHKAPRVTKVHTE